MKYRLFPLALALLFPLLPLISLAAPPAEVPWAQGTLKKVEQAAGRATIAHGPIDSIGMGPMTMMFPVKDTAGLAKVKDGDKVRFQAVMAGGDIVVTRIEALK
jgi:Cu(I)/Ag(I) efflux system periplasmic protein CusF